MTVRCDDGWTQAGREITGRLPKPLRMMACDGVALQGMHIKMRAELSPYRPDLFFWPKILSVKLLTAIL